VLHNILVFASVPNRVCKNLGFLKKPAGSFFLKNLKTLGFYLEKPKVLLKKPAVFSG